MVQFHNIKFNIKPNKRVGKGGKRGKTSGKGAEGQKKRAGRHIHPSWKESILRSPKLRGVDFKSRHPKPFVVYLKSIDRAFSAGELVDRKSLSKKGLMRPKKKEARTPIKILGEHKLSKNLIFHHSLQLSDVVKREIEKSKSLIQ